MNDIVSFDISLTLSDFKHRVIRKIVGELIIFEYRWMQK